MWTQGKTFAFYVVLQYEIIIRFHCICIYAILLYDMWWNLDIVTQDALQKWQYGAEILDYFLQINLSKNAL